MRTTLISTKVWLVTRVPLIAGLLVFVTAASVGAQVELDRILARVNGSVITRSDVRQARLLKLVADASSDDAAQRGLEDRILILGELSRAAPLDPISDGDLAAHRGEWELSVGAANVTNLLAQNGMSESSLQGWLRDDLRVRAYLRRQFSALPDPDRARATADWLARLRQRAGLS
jgi:hypothetical protein